MPLPIFLLIGAAAAGLWGVKKGVDAYSDFDEAKNIDKSARDVYDKATNSLERCRDRVQAKLEELGRQKVALYQETLTPFVDVFSRIKHVDFADLGISDEYLVDIEADILDIRETSVQMSEAVGGGAGALGAGALAGLAAYGSVGLLGTASTGAAISGLSGVAATNATLAWLGGGSLAAGGMGIAGGTAVLGGIVAAPVLLVGGLLLASKAEAAKENARSNLTKAKAAAKSMRNAESAARAIGRMADQTRNLLQNLCGHLSEDIAVLKHIVRGNDDYRTYDAEEKAVVARAATVAVTLKHIAETPLLEEDGSVTEAIGDTVRKAKDFLEQPRSHVGARIKEKSRMTADSVSVTDDVIREIGEQVSLALRRKMPRLGGTAFDVARGSRCIEGIAILTKTCRQFVPTRMGVPTGVTSNLLESPLRNWTLLTRGDVGMLHTQRTI